MLEFICGFNNDDLKLSFASLVNKDTAYAVTYHSDDKRSQNIRQMEQHQAIASSIPITFIFIVAELPFFHCGTADLSQTC